LLAWVVLLCMGVPTVAARAVAHPADEGRQDVVFTVQQGQLTWTHDVWLGPLLGMPMWAQQIDMDGDGAASPGEQQAFIDNLRTMIELRIDGQVVPAHLAGFHVAVQTEFVAQPAQPQVTMVFTAPLSAGRHTLDFRSMIDTHRIKFAGRFPATDGVQIDSPSADAEHYRAVLNIQSSALERPRVSAPAAQSQPVAQPVAEAIPARVEPDAAAANSALAPAIRGLIEGGNLSPGLFLLGLAVSFGVGAVHALTPGHGKGIIAAYMVGERGRMSHALALAGTMTVTHTASVIVLGLIALLASRIILPQTLTPWLTLISGALILAVGGNLLGQRLRHRESTQDAAHGHTYAPAHDHVAPHTHEDGSTHTHDSHTHTHLSLNDVRDARTRRITWRSLLMLGVSGGLLPCADALAILLLSVSVNRIGLGLVLLLAFSLGIALTLTLIGVIAAGGQRVLRRYNRLQPLLARLPLASAAVVLVLGVVMTYEGILALLR
jgi:ABC-type nickel/cobalt efflux system permease component RcnA